MSELKLGMVGLDTSHVMAFSNILHNKENPNHVSGGRVVTAYKGGSPDFHTSWSRVDGFTQKLQEEHGVAIVDTIGEVAEQVDAIFLESCDGRQHLEQFAELAPFGKPVFVDKPFTTGIDDAKAILELSKKHNAPFFSCSGVRFVPELVALGGGARVEGCITFGPAAILDDYPGLFWYGIHSAEVLLSKMGTGCKEVTVTKTETADVVSGIWSDGRVGTMYGNRIEGAGKFGATVMTANGVETAVAQSSSYHALMQNIVEFFKTGESPIDIQQTIEIVAFLDAANEARESGKTVSLKVS